MFETIRIKLLGTQPAAKVTDQLLERIIHRDFGNSSDEVKQKLREVISDSQNGKNRISAAIIKLSNKDIKAIDHYIAMSNNDSRDVISQAEYPRCSKLGFDEMEEHNMKLIYLSDWIEYSKWINQ
jgi:hypothetical protein